MVEEWQDTRITLSSHEDDTHRRRLQPSVTIYVLTKEPLTIKSGLKKQPKTLKLPQNNKL